MLSWPSVHVTPSIDHGRHVELLEIAKERCLDAFDIARQTYDEPGQAYALLGAASAAYYACDPHRAVVLYGSGDAVIDKLQLVWESVFRDRRNDQLATLRETLGHADFDATYQTGSTLSLAEAIAVARDITI